MRYGMAIDLDRCIGCRTCAVICKDHNAEPEGIWWNRVFVPGAPEYGTSALVDGAPRMEFLPVACQHCENAPCQTVCPTGATYTDEDTGAVLVDYERCIGCRYCITACPYGARQFNWSAPAELDGTDGKTYAYGYPSEVRLDGHLVYAPKRPEGVAEKCTFCVQYTSQGIEPACCSGCPANARIFGDLDDPSSEVSMYLAGKASYVIGEEYATNPKVRYLSSTRGTAEHAATLASPVAAGAEAQAARGEGSAAFGTKTESVAAGSASAELAGSKESSALSAVMEGGAR